MVRSDDGRRRGHSRTARLLTFVVQSSVPKGNSDLALVHGGRRIVCHGCSCHRWNMNTMLSRLLVSATPTDPLILRISRRRRGHAAHPPRHPLAPLPFRYSTHTTPVRQCHVMSLSCSRLPCHAGHCRCRRACSMKPHAARCSCCM
jgi:hypothetical protein